MEKVHDALDLDYTPLDPAPHFVGTAENRRRETDLTRGQQRSGPGRRIRDAAFGRHPVFLLENASQAVRDEVLPACRRSR